MVKIVHATCTCTLWKVQKVPECKFFVPIRSCTISINTVYTSAAIYAHIVHSSLSLSPLLSFPVLPFSLSLLSPLSYPYQAVSEPLPFHTDRWICRKQFLQISKEHNQQATNTLQTLHYIYTSQPHTPSVYLSVSLVSCSLVSTQSLCLQM